MAPGHHSNGLRIDSHAADFDVPPPKLVKDITGHEIELPRALGIGGVETCVAAWKQLENNNLRSGNRQRPYGTHREDTPPRLLLGNRNGTQLWSKGTFIEIGAFDGVTESNSQLFERCVNWTGILIEPNRGLVEPNGHQLDSRIGVSPSPPMCRHPPPIRSSVKSRETRPTRAGERPPAAWERAPASRRR